MEKLKDLCCDDVQDDRTCFQEFAGEISLEGIKYLLPQYGPRLRRFLWLIVNIGISTLLCYHVSILVSSFINKPISVKIDNQLRSRALFPSVLLCNSMPFKLSKVNPRGEMHKALSDIFATPWPNQTRVERHKDLLKNVKDRLDYLLHVTFSLEDMVVHCVYKNEHCNLTAHFETVSVEGKICYLFNGRNDENKSSDYPYTYGTNFRKDGLQLTLNAMTYQAMNGPYTTQGVEVSFAKYGSQSYADDGSQVMVLIGQTNNLRIQEAQTNYLEGQTCGELKLEFFGEYTVQNCYVEQQLKRIRKYCNCLSASGKMGILAANDNVAKCSLYDYLNCEIKYYGNIISEDVQLCPRHCEETTYNVGISQAKTAWDRKIGEFDQQNFEKKLADDLATVNEIGIRYLPKRNETTRRVIDNLLTRFNHSDVTLWRVTREFADYVAHIEDVPPSNFSSSVNEFKGKMTSWTNETRVVLKLLNETVTNFTVALRDAGIAPNQSEATESDDPLNLSGGLPQSSFKDWLKFLIDIFWPSVNELRSMVHEIGASSPWMKFLPKNHTEFLENELNGTVTEYFNLLVEPDGLEMTGARSHMPGFHNETAHLTMIDAQTCAFYILDPYLTDDGRDALAPKINAGLPSVHQDISTAQEKAYCRLMLCTFLNESGSNCTIDENDGLELAVEITNSVQEYIQQVLVRVNSLNVTMEDYFEGFKQNTTDSAEVLHEHVESIQMHMEAVDNAFPNGTEEGSIWPAKRMQWMKDLIRDIDNYVYHEGSFQLLSNDVVENYDALAQTFTQQEANLASELGKLLNLDIEPLLESLEYLLDLNSAAANNSDASQYGPFSYAANTYLWGNMTATFIEEIRDRTVEIQSLVNHTMSEIGNNSAGLQNAMRGLVSSASDFRRDNQIQEHFYEKNFIMVNIAFQSLELYSVQQKPAYNFWTFLSDFGGTTGLYNGFCVVSIFQVIDVIVRRWFIYKMPCCAHCGKRVGDNSTETDEFRNGHIANSDKASTIVLPKKF